MARTRKAPIETPPGDGQAAAFPPVEVDHSTEKSITLEWMQNYHANSPNKEQIITYLMRLYPEIDLRLTNGPDCVKYIDKAEIFTRDQILSVHGTGAYQLSFHDMSRPRNKRRVGLCILELFEPGIDPIVDLRTVVWDSAKNRPFISRLAQLGKLPPNVMPYGVSVAAPGVVPVAPAASAAPVVPVSPRRLVDEVRDMLELGDMIRGGGQAGGGDVSDSLALQLLKELRDDNRRLREAAAAPAAAGGPLAGMDVLRQTTSLLKEFGWSPPGLGAAVAAAAPAAADPAAVSSAIEKYLPVVGQVVSDVRGMLELFMAKPAAAPAASGVGNAAASNAAASAAANDNRQIEGAAESEPLEDNKVDMIELLKQFAEPAFARFAAREEPAKLAADVMANDGAQPLRLLIDQGAKKIIFFLSFVPDLAERLKTARRSKPELEKWIHDFIEAAKLEVSK